MYYLGVCGDSILPFPLNGALHSHLFSLSSSSAALNPANGVDRGTHVEGLLSRPSHINTRGFYLAKDWTKVSAAAAYIPNKQTITNEETKPGTEQPPSRPPPLRCSSNLPAAVQNLASHKVPPSGTPPNHRVLTCRR